jgi:hypothetical protein
MAMGDGRGVSAQIGGVNKLAIGPDDDLYVGEYERVLRIADPVGGMGGRPTAAPRGPAAACAAIAKWGTATLRSHLVTAAEPPALDELRAAINRLDGEDELKQALNRRYLDQEDLDGNDRANTLLRRFGAERCGLMDGLLPLDARQTMRFCATYLREWDKVNELERGDDRQKDPARKSAPLLPAEILPPRAPRTPDWDGQLLEFAQGACAIPYRWATRFAQ